MSSITNWGGIAPRNTRTRTIDDFFNNTYRQMVGGMSRLSDDDQLSVPATNVREIDKGYMLELSMPGFTKENIDIQVNNNVMTVSAQMKDVEEDDHYTRREFHYRTYQRSFTLPKNAIEEGIKAQYENGILMITVPMEEKPDAAKDTKRIMVS